MTQPEDVERVDAASASAASGTSRRAASIVGRTVGLAVTAACVWFLIASLSQRLDDLRAAGELPTVGGLAVAVAVSLAANLLLADTWRTLMGLAGQPVRALPALWVWSVGQLARYAFGPLLVAARAAAMREEEQSGTAAAITSVIEVLLLITTSAVIVLATLPSWAPTGAAPSWLAAAGLAPVAILVVVAVRPRATIRLLARVAMWERLPRGVRRRLAPLADGVTLSTRAVVGLITRHALNWALRMAVFLTVLASTGAALDPLPGMVGAYAVGVFIGFLAIFSPGGLGVRELGTAALLTPLVGGDIALATVAAVRVAEIIAEVLGLAGVWLVRRGLQD